MNRRLWTAIVVVFAVMVSVAIFATHALWPAAPKTAPVDDKIVASATTEGIGTTVGDTKASAVASIQGASDCAKEGVNISLLMKQRTKIDGGCVNTSVRQDIEFRGNEAATVYEQGEADAKRAAGKAKLEEQRAKNSARVGKPHPTEVKVAVTVGGKIAVEGKVDAGGTVTHVGTVNNTGTVQHEGKILHQGEIVHNGKVVQDGHVVTTGDIKIAGTLNGQVTGTIEVQGKPIYVTRNCRGEWVPIQ